MGAAAQPIAISHDDTFADRLNNFANAANRVNGPLWAFGIVGLLSAILSAYILGPWLMAAAWSIHTTDWPRGARICFGLAAVSLVVVLFGGINLFLRLMDCQALQFTIPIVAWLRAKHPPALETWSGIAALVIGMLIGETIFT
jgi:hypothetical protein